eukprot:TRINITY_DN8492_c0_g1_i1.p1 TRINITY_DN8492_c0_g1~~TRINITY_DN8492_c0_g1_i1.p1  ORF type:complete len:1277 (+),score=240.38 TRINITY_DN8492_c0_g1_i1:74-3904(+)
MATMVCYPLVPRPPHAPAAAGRRRLSEMLPAAGVAAAESHAAAELRQRASIAAAQDAAARRLVRALQAALHSAGQLLVWRLQRAEDCAREDLLDDEEAARGDAFLAVLAEIEELYGRTVAPRLQLARRWARAVAAVSAEEESERHPIEVAQDAGWNQLGFLAEHSVHMATRHGPAWAEERAALQVLERQTREWVAESRDSSRAELAADEARSRAAAEAVPQGLVPAHRIFMDEGRDRAAYWTEYFIDVRVIESKRPRPPPSPPRSPGREAIWFGREPGQPPPPPPESPPRAFSPSQWRLCSTDAARVECSQLEDCHREVLVGREEEQRQRLRVQASEEHGLASRGQGKARPRKKLPSSLVPMAFEESCAYQEWCWMEFWGRRKICNLMVAAETELRWSRRRKWALAGLARVRPEVRGAADQRAAAAASWADRLSRALTDILADFIDWSRDYQEDVCMENGLTHGWELLQHIARNAAERLRLECGFLIHEAVCRVATGGVDMGAVHDAEAGAAHTDALGSMRQDDPLLLEPFDKRCAAWDAARAACAQQWMHLLADHTAATRRLLADFTSSVHAAVTSWHLGAGRSQPVAWQTAKVFAEGVAGRVGDEAAAEASAALDDAEAQLQAAAHEWHAEALGAATRTSTLRSEWCRSEAAAVAAGSCCGPELARRRAVRRPQVRQTHAHSDALLSEASLLLEGEWRAAEMRLSEPDLQGWLQTGHQLACRDFAGDPHAREQWHLRMETFYEQGLYAMRRGALVALIQAHGEVTACAQETRRRAEALEHEIVNRVLFGDELPALVTACEHQQAATAGSDPGGRELLSLQVMAREAAERARTEDEERGERLAALRDAVQPEPPLAALLTRELGEWNRLHAEQPEAGPEPGTVGWVKARAKELDQMEAESSGAAKDAEAAEATALAGALAMHGVCTLSAFQEMRTVPWSVPARRRPFVAHAAAAARQAAESKLQALRVFLAPAAGSGVLMPRPVAALRGSYSRRSAAAGQHLFRQDGGAAAVCLVAGQWLLLPTWRDGVDPALWDAPAPERSGAGAPKHLRFTASGAAQEVAGVYALEPDAHNGQPVWALDSSQGCGRIYANDEGYWVVAWGSGPAGMYGAVESVEPHAGRDPSQVAGWLWFDRAAGEWEHCRAQAAPVGAPGGPPPPSSTQPLQLPSSSPRSALSPTERICPALDPPPLSPLSAPRRAVAASPFLLGPWPQVLDCVAGGLQVAVRAVAPSRGGAGVTVAVRGESRALGERLRLEAARCCPGWGEAGEGDLSCGD